MFSKNIDLLKNDIIASTCNLIKFQSILSKSTNPQMPFGENCNKALEYILDLGNHLGFRTKNIDGYCGYIEFGKGNELIGIIGHLDVVPEGENWTYPPFSATIADGKMYGRGAIDDKGPVIASLYAMKIVMDTCKVNKRVRLILGLNEENDWKCIEHYKEKEEIPSFGFSPDADFPCIYAEKGLLSAYLSAPYHNENKIKIIDIDCNNNAINVVPKYCKITLSVDSSLSIDECIHNLKEIVERNHFDISIAKENSNIILTSYGISAHSAHPELGKNAISQAIITLHEFFEIYLIRNELFDYFCKAIGLKYNGESLGIHIIDESGLLTLNVAQFDLKDSNLVIGINLRIPIHTSIKTIKEKITSSLPHSISINFSGEKEPLYLSKENWLIKTLCNVFHEVTGLDSTPIAIGGATYARAFPNFVSFGANMPGDKDMCHQVDEFISIDNLILATNIYARAIYELSK
ncbi:MAG: dipeptidase PepV [Clostridia bacterium]|nr:dipeptidase PepV [Clostridia bacterium]